MSSYTTSTRRITVDRDRDFDYPSYHSRRRSIGDPYSYREPYQSYYGAGDYDRGYDRGYYYDEPCHETVKRIVVRRSGDRGRDYGYYY